MSIALLQRILQSSFLQVGQHFSFRQLLRGIAAPHVKSLLNLSVLVGELYEDWLCKRRNVNLADVLILDSVEPNLKLCGHKRYPEILIQNIPKMKFELVAVGVSEASEVALESEDLPLIIHADEECASLSVSKGRN